MAASSTSKGIVRRASLAFPLILSLGLVTTSGLCQGAAEYGALSSHVAATTAKAGSALGNAAQQVSGRLQQKLSKSAADSPQASRPLSPAPAGHPVATAPGAAPAKGMQILYAPGGAKTPDAKNDAASPPQPCVSPSDNDSPKSKGIVPCRGNTQEKYPSVVNLSFGN